VSEGWPSVFGLEGRSAAVTGAARGIGRVAALVLARAGASLALGDLDEAGLEAAAAELRAAGTAVVARRTDVARRDDAEALVSLALEAFGRLDVMANVAGILQVGPVAETREADLDRVLAVNLKGVYFGCQAASAAMVRAGAGSIVNVASSAAFEPHPGLSCYSIAKAGVVALTRVLAAEVGPAGVRVNAVAPGMVETDMASASARRPDGTIDPARMERVRERTRQRNPLRTTGRPEDVAYAILFLASDASRYVTGQVLHPNGGVPMV
jgi:3-oxoacyl-[acyl-carrier protein] reductase